MGFSRRNFLLSSASLAGAVLLLATTVNAADSWSSPAAEFAAMILAKVHSSQAMALTVRNLSSLGEEDVAQIRRQLRAQFRSKGARLTASKQARVEIRVTLSENAAGYIWVGEIRIGSSNEVAMISIERPASAEFRPVAEPLNIRKTRFYAQAVPMLDALTLERPDSSNATTSAMAVILGSDSVSVFERSDQAGVAEPVWKLAQSLPIAQLGTRIRDLRGRLVVGRENTFGVYLPGESCAGSLEPVFKLECNESSDPWPSIAGGAQGVSSHFNADRNFFDGRISLEDNRAFVASPFYSAAFVPLKTGAYWLMTGLDGQIQIYNSNMDSLGTFSGWGSNITAVRVACGDGWQALVSKTGDYTVPDAVQAIDVANRKGVPASAPVEFDGPVTALWPLGDATAAVAIVHNLKTGNYEAFRLSISCGQ